MHVISWYCDQREYHASADMVVAAQGAGTPRIRGVPAPRAAPTIWPRIGDQRGEGDRHPAPLAMRERVPRFRESRTGRELETRT